MSQLNSVFVIGESRTNADNAITKIYGSFYMAFEVEEGTHRVLSFSCTHTLNTTEDFLRRLFLNRNLLDLGFDLETELNRRYGGSSRKAVLVSYRDAVKRYRDMTGI
ncbi:MAG: DUF3870 domain-containing protein [Lawsonibacter sp.]|nr:DUF3870 domain-containing protein [Lawsonibacter sp.]